MKVLAIIPCCGFGTRMSMKTNESKELLVDPKTNKPLLEWHLDLCKKYKLKPFIITRKEKIDLIEYCNKNNISCFVTEAGKEWMDTVELSRPYWHENNILLLPDTRFSKKTIIKDIKTSLLFGNNVTYALHKVTNITQWGWVTKYGYCEKPSGSHYDEGYAWGIIGFKRYTDIFKGMSKKGIFREHEAKTSFVFLDKFYDVTRTGEIKYE